MLSVSDIPELESDNIHDIEADKTIIIENEKELTYTTEIAFEAVQKRVKFQPNEQKAIIEIYDSFNDKALAMKMIKQIEGFENIYERKIIFNWPKF